MGTRTAKAAADCYRFHVRQAPVGPTTTLAEVLTWYQAENARLVSELQAFMGRQGEALAAQMQRDFGRVTSH